MHRQTKATAIPASVKAAVALRDRGGRCPATCIVCGAPGAPVAHVVRRSQGGRGDTERNIVTLCNRCHYAFDEGLFIKELEQLGFCSRQDIKDFIYAYMEAQYPGWTPESVKYHKYEEVKSENELE